MSKLQYDSLLDMYWPIMELMHWYLLIRIYFIKHRMQEGLLRRNSILAGIG
jgi:hypothetical protein